MPHITVPMTARQCLVPVYVGASRRLLDLYTKYKLQPPDPVMCMALLDTGATGTCVDPRVLNRITQHPIDVVAVHTPSTGLVPHLTRQYDVAIHVYQTGTDGRKESSYLLSHEVDVTESILSGMGIDVLLGMDVLSRCLFIADGPHGQFTLGI